MRALHKLESELLLLLRLSYMCLCVSVCERLRSLSIFYPMQMRACLIPLNEISIGSGANKRTTQLYRYTNSINICINFHPANVISRLLGCFCISHACIYKYTVRESTVSIYYCERERAFWWLIAERCACAHEITQPVVQCSDISLAAAFLGRSLPLDKYYWIRLLARAIIETIHIGALAAVARIRTHPPTPPAALLPRLQ